MPLYGVIPVMVLVPMWEQINKGMGNYAKENDAFSAYHPVVNFVFYIGAFLFGMILVHPIYLVCSMILSGAYYVTIRGQAGLKYVLGMVPFFVLLSVINPLFNTLGDTVLFTWLDGRHYTLEALCYGMALAALFVSALGWFASYNAVMTSDKFLYLFGRFAPSLSLVLTMVLRFVPTYQKRVIQIGSVRKCIGKSGNDGTGREKAENGLTIVLTAWAAVDFDAAAEPSFPYTAGIEGI